MTPDIIQQLKDLNKRMHNIVCYLIVRRKIVTPELKKLELWLNDDWDRLNAYSSCNNK
jgi:hypothetical protein